MWDVYDWIGSLSCAPKYFSLTKDTKEPISPALLAMTADDEPLPLMEDDHQVGFYGNHFSGEMLEDTPLDQIEDLNATEGKVNSTEGQVWETNQGDKDRWAEMSNQAYQVAPVGHEK